MLGPGIYEDCHFCGGEGAWVFGGGGIESFEVDCPRCEGSGVVPHHCDRSEVEWGEVE